MQKAYSNTSARLSAVPTMHICFVQFVQNNQVLATLPGDGVGQNLISVEACAINQPHVHPRGTEITHITKGKSIPKAYCVNPSQSPLSLV